MVYGVLLRGINVGKSVRVDMKRLKELLLDLGCSNVTTYINSGNALLESSQSAESLSEAIVDRLKFETGHHIPTLVKRREDLVAIAQAIPSTWQNDDVQRTDVAYLFPPADSPDTIGALNLNHDVVDVRYVPGALLWNFRREHATKTRLNKITAHRLYDALTLRNVNTARVMAGMSKTGETETSE